MDKVVSEDPSAEIGITRKVKPDDAYWPVWSAFYRKALSDLALERAFLPMGGMAPLSFSSYNEYAKRHDITGADFDIFCYVMRKLDDVCVTVINKPRSGTNNG